MNDSTRFSRIRYAVKYFREIKNKISLIKNNFTQTRSIFSFTAKFVGVQVPWVFKHQVVVPIAFHFVGPFRNVHQIDVFDFAVNGGEGNNRPE